MKKAIAPVFLFVMLFLYEQPTTYGQLTPSQEPYYTSIDQAELWYDQHVFGPAKSAFDALMEHEPRNNSDELFWAKAQTFKQLSALKKGTNEAEIALLKLANEYRTSPYRNLVFQELAAFYMEKEDFAAASSAYDEIDYDLLQDDLFSALHFMNGYTKFVTKDFDAAKVQFKKVTPFKDKYFYPAHYYHGMAAYFTEDVDEAIEKFSVLENSVAYKDRTPYLITQLQFKKKAYDVVIDYGTQRIQNANTKNIKEIRGLIGQSYFIKEAYENAIPHLAYYVDHTKKLRAEDFYQLGFAYYQTEQFNEAIDQFIEIANEDSPLGHNANNYLAKSYVQKGDRNAALAAFKRTASMDYIEGLQEEANFNYGKLSAELGYDREALDLLKNIKPVSPYFAESQIVLSDVLNNTKDYERALQFIEDMEMQSPPIQATYQRLAYLYGMQFLIDQRFTEAERYFLTSLKRAVNSRFTTLAYFRLAALYNQQFKYKESKVYMDKFLNGKQDISELPNDVHLGHAHYIQGYNHLKTNGFSAARGHLVEASKVYKSQGNIKLQMDALLRAADCYFRDNKYTSASRFYAEAIELKQKGTDYALYQKGIIEGLEGKPYEKLVTLDKLIDSYPSSSLAEFALFQNAETLLALEEPSEANRSFKQILENYPSTSLKTRVLLKLGLIAFNQGNNNDAIRYYKDVFKQNPSSNELQEAIIALEEIYVGYVGDPNAFFDFVEKESGIKINQFERDSLSYKASTIQYENGAYDKAIASYTEYLNSFPEGFNLLSAHYKRGESFLNLRRFEEALSDYEFVISRGVSSYYLPALHKSAVICFYQVQDYSKAFDYYSLLEEIERDVELQYEAQVGAMKSAMKMDDQEALQYMSEKVLDNPLMKEEDGFVARYNVSKVLYANKEYDAAIPLLNQVIAAGLSEQAAEAHYIQSRIAYERDQLDEADSRIRQFIVDYKSYPLWIARNLILLSDVLVKKEDLLQAKAALEAVIENYKSDESITQEATDKLQRVIKLENERNRIEEQTNDGTLILEKENNGQNK